MTWLEFVNKVFFQWFFVRLTRHQEKVIKEFNLDSVSVNADGSTGIEGCCKNYDVLEYYSIQFWILPLTGWNDKFVYLNRKPKFLKLTRKKLKK